MKEENQVGSLQLVPVYWKLRMGSHSPAEVDIVEKVGDAEIGFRQQQRDVEEKPLDIEPDLHHVVGKTEVHRSKGRQQLKTWMHFFS